MPVIGWVNKYKSLMQSGYWSIEEHLSKSCSWHGVATSTKIQETRNKDNPCIPLLLLSLSLSSKPFGRSLHSPLVECLKSSFSQSIHIKTWDSALSCSHLKQLRQCVPLTKIHKESAPARNISQFRFAMWIHRYLFCPEVSMNLHDIKLLVVEYLHPPHWNGQKNNPH